MISEMFGVDTGGSRSSPTEGVTSGVGLIATCEFAFDLSLFAFCSERELFFAD
jgi:hypothetical protein